MTGAPRPNTANPPPTIEEIAALLAGGETVQTVEIQLQVGRLAAQGIPVSVARIEQFFGGRPLRALGVVELRGIIGALNAVGRDAAEQVDADGTARP